MARSRITRANKSITEDDGSIIQSIIAGEQLRTQVTLSWFTSLDGCKIRARVVEADNSGLTYTDGTPDNYPRVVDTDGVSQYLPIRYQDSEGSYITVDADTETGGFVEVQARDSFETNSFELIWDADIVKDFNPLPKPDQPVYAFMALEVRDSGTGKNQQVYKPLRGLVELRYSVNPLDIFS